MPRGVLGSPAGARSNPTRTSHKQTASRGLRCDKMRINASNIACVCGRGCGCVWVWREAENSSYLYPASSLNHDYSLEWRVRSNRLANIPHLVPPSLPRLPPLSGHLVRRVFWRCCGEVAALRTWCVMRRDLRMEDESRRKKKKEIT